jgi:hypothetical protein
VKVLRIEHLFDDLVIPISVIVDINNPSPKPMGMLGEGLLKI